MDTTRRAYKGSSRYLRRPMHQAPPTVTMSGWPPPSAVKEWKAQYRGLFGVVQDEQSGYVALLGDWERPPAVLEAAGIVFGDGRVNGWGYVLTHEAYLPEGMLTAIVPPQRRFVGEHTIVGEETLRRLAQRHPRHEQKALEELLNTKGEEMRRAYQG